MREIWREIMIHAAPRDIYRALTEMDGLKHFWTTDTRGDPGLGGKLEFWFGSFCEEMKVTALEKDAIVRWKPGKVGIDAWVGTDIEFKIFIDDQGRTMLHFHHSNWRDNEAIYPRCSTHWATYLLSLKEYVETGTGRPYPYDVPIFVWREQVLEPA